jgi:hypothetical protein
MAVRSDDDGLMPVAKIAEALGVTRGAVYQALDRGLQKVKAGLEQRGYSMADLTHDHADGRLDVND